MASFATFFHGRMTGFEITCLQSFLDHGHDVEIFSYGKCSAPAHFKLVDAARVLKKRHLFRYKSGPGEGSVSGFTNTFRYALLAVLDVWWVDTDVICLSKDWPSAGGPICAAWEDDEMIGSAVLRLERAHAAELRDYAASLGKKIAWGVTGPRLVTRFARTNNLLKSILPSHTFYPIHYDEWEKVLRPDFKDYCAHACQGSYACHLWNEMARRGGIDKARLPDPNSFFGSLVATHGTERFFGASDQGGIFRLGTSWRQRFLLGKTIHRI